MQVDVVFTFDPARCEGRFAVRVEERVGEIRRDPEHGLWGGRRLRRGRQTLSRPAARAAHAHILVCENLGSFVHGEGRERGEAQRFAGGGDNDILVLAEHVRAVLVDRRDLLVGPAVGQRGGVGLLKADPFVGAPFRARHVRERSGPGRDQRERHADQQQPLNTGSSNHSLPHTSPVLTCDQLSRVFRPRIPSQEHKLLPAQCNRNLSWTR